MSASDRLQELVARYASGTLSEPEARELDRLLAAETEMSTEDLDLAAAALDLALTRVEKPLPEEIKRRVAERLRREVTRAAPSAAVLEMPARTSERSVRTTNALPWLAAAAALLIAVVGWWPRVSPGPEIASTAERISAGELPGALSRDWTATEDPAAAQASGGVVWSASDQQGYMRISGLAANDPTREQYQLWIFDRERDERFPVDGGVFDIPAGETEVLVPIQAKLPVGEAYLFAVTVEPPGGVVVSSRERIVLVAEV